MTRECVELDKIGIPGYIKARKSGSVVTLTKDHFKLMVGKMDNDSIITITMKYKDGSEHSVSASHKFLASGEGDKLSLNKSVLYKIVKHLEQHTSDMHAKIRLDKYKDIYKV